MYVLDADELRRSLCSDLGFDMEDRVKNITRIARVAQAISQCGVITLVAAITPLRSMRSELRRTLSPYYEVYVSAPYAICEQRDVKGLYRAARVGDIRNFTGLDSVFEEPLFPDIVCDTVCETVEQSTRRLVGFADSTFLGHQRTLQ